MQNLSQIETNRVLFQRKQHPTIMSGFQLDDRHWKEFAFDTSLIYKKRNWYVKQKYHRFQLEIKHGLPKSLVMDFRKKSSGQDSPFE